ncbi:MAG: hypothetical protein V1779_06855 [bacterium]
MVKLLIILGIIFLVILLAVSAVRKKLEKIFQQFVPNQGESSTNDASVEEVLYEKDDVVVLRGEGKDRRTE